MPSTGRPLQSRTDALTAIRLLPRAGRHLVRVNGRTLATALGCDRSTVTRMIRDLEQAGSLRRVRSKGRSGLLVQLLNPPPRVGRAGPPT